MVDQIIKSGAIGTFELLFLIAIPILFVFNGLHNPGERDDSAGPDLVRTIEWFASTEMVTVQLHRKPRF